MEILMSSVLEQSPVETLSSPEENPYLFSVDEFYRMLEMEFFPREARVGLWDGRIYEKMAKTQPHAVASINATMTLIRALPTGWCLSGENPFTVSHNKAPLPDLIVLRGKGNDYLKRRPGAADVGLVVEFSLSSLKIDTGSKLEAYARAGVVAYWVLNLKDNVIHVYHEPIPAEGRYALMTKVAPGESIPFALDGVLVGPIAASDLLPIG
jgi:Uma2 family endonuclease